MNYKKLFIPLFLTAVCIASTCKAQCLEPTDFIRSQGFEVDVNFSYFLESDDVRAIFWPGFPISQTFAPIWLIFDGDVGFAQPANFVFEARTNTPGLSYTIEAFNWNDNTYEVLGSGSQSFNIDEIVTFEIDPVDHVDVNGEVRARLGWRKTGFTIVSPWQVEVDWFAFCLD